MILLNDEFGEVVVPSESKLTPQPLVNTAEFEVEPEVSLYALTNASNLKIFRLAASYRDHSVEVLIDIGSHNNFIQEGLVDQLGLQLVSAPRFRVYKEMVIFFYEIEFALLFHLCYRAMNSW